MPLAATGGNRVLALHTDGWRTDFKGRFMAMAKTGLSESPVSCKPTLAEVGIDKTCAPGVVSPRRPSKRPGAISAENTHWVRGVRASVEEAKGWPAATYGRLI